MAPEVVKKLEFSRFSDIWSLGCTVIEMSTGIPPWSEHKDAISVLYCIYNTEKPPTIPDNISKELYDFITCCLKMKPKERYNVYQLLRHPFITGDYQQPVAAKIKEIEFKRYHSEERSTK
jgi:serine/threonine protein kinase